LGGGGARIQGEKKKINGRPDRDKNAWRNRAQKYRRDQNQKDFEPPILSTKKIHKGGLNLAVRGVRTGEKKKHDEKSELPCEKARGWKHLIPGAQSGTQMRESKIKGKRNENSPLWESRGGEKSRPLTQEEVSERNRVGKREARHAPKKKFLNHTEEQ